MQVGSYTSLHMKPRMGLSACASSTERHLAENHLKWILCAGTTEAAAAANYATCTLCAPILSAFMICIPLEE